MNDPHDLADKILAELHLAAEGVSRAELVRKCGPFGVKVQTAERRVREALTWIVMVKHYAVYSDGRGFKLAKNAAEIRGWIAGRRRAVRSEDLKLRQLEKLLPTMTYAAPQQLVLTGG